MSIRIVRRAHRRKQDAKECRARACGVLRIGVLVDAESHGGPLACQHVRLLCDDARLKIGRPGGFAWFRRRSDQTFPDRYSDGTLAGPLAATASKICRSPASTARLLDTLAADSSPGRCLGRRPVGLSPSDTHAWTVPTIDRIHAVAVPTNDDILARMIEIIGSFSAKVSTKVSKRSSVTTFKSRRDEHS